MNYIELKADVATEHLNLNILPKGFSATAHTYIDNSLALGIFTKTGWSIKCTYYRDDVGVGPGPNWLTFNIFDKKWVAKSDLRTSLDFLCRMHDVEYNWVWPEYTLYNGKFYKPEDWSPKNPYAKSSVPIQLDLPKALSS